MKSFSESPREMMMKPRAHNKKQDNEYISMIRNRHQNKRIRKSEISIFPVVLFLVLIFSLILTTNTFNSIPVVNAASEGVQENTEDIDNVITDNDLRDDSFEDSSEDSTEDTSTSSGNSLTMQADETGFVNYTGDIDPVTGQPIVNGGAQKQTTSNSVTLRDGATFDSENNMFVYTVVGGAIGCSASDGMVVTGAVTFASVGEINIAVYRDGLKYDGIPASVEDTGSYVVLTWDNDTEEEVMSFQIVESTTGRLNQYILPTGFTLRSVNFNGVPTKGGYGSVDMSQEGYYEIVYRCNQTGIDYYLNVTTDHTPPDVKFEGVDKEGRASGPVTITGLTDDDKVFVQLDEQDSRIDKNNQLTESGRYHVTVVDSAGNSVSRDFVIMIYLNVKGVVFLSLLILIIIGVLVALYISRKRLRVR